MQKSKWAAVLGLAAATALACTSAVAQNYPSKRLDWTIAFGPGGGNDIMSRNLIGILEKYKWYPEQIVAENRPGGSGAKGWGYVFAQKGNPYHITSTSGSYITTPLQANTPWQPTSFTPIARSTWPRCSSAFSTKCSCGFPRPCRGRCPSFPMSTSCGGSTS